MWRMFKAGIMGVIIGVIGGAIVGHISYVKNYKEGLNREIRSNAVMYNNNESDEDKVIRIKVDYDGNGGSDTQSEKSQTMLATQSWTK